MGSPEKEQHTPLAPMNVEGIVAIIAGSPEDIRQRMIRGAEARVVSAEADGREPSVFDHYASLGNVSVIGDLVIVRGSSKSHPVRLGTGEKNRRRDEALKGILKPQVEIEGEA